MFVPTLQDTTNAQGCYLHHHKNGAVWECSGNAVGQSLLDRNKQHATSAQLTRPADMASNFYMSFPAKTMPYSDARRRGFFCQLEQYCGLAFLPARALHIHEINGERALFVWDDRHIQRLTQIKFKGVADDDIIRHARLA